MFNNQNQDSEDGLMMSFAMICSVTLMRFHLEKLDNPEAAFDALLESWKKVVWEKHNSDLKNYTNLIEGTELGKSLKDQGTLQDAEEMRIQIRKRINNVAKQLKATFSNGLPPKPEDNSGE